MSDPLILASSSSIRLKLLQSAGIQVSAYPARIDEDAIRRSLQAGLAKPDDIADALAELKARKLAEKNPTSLVLGCDQVLAIGSEILNKPETVEEAESQISRLQGKTHQLLSAVVLYDDNKPIWRHMGVARMTMRTLSQDYLTAYLSRNWPDIATSVGGYKLESEGVRLFSRIEGDYFTILGLPLLPLLGYLGDRGFLQT